jgi:transcriptional antiterminator RfaH
MVEARSERAPGARWYLVNSRPKGEKTAAFHLRAQGFVSFLPQFEKTVRHARRLVTVRAPLFQRYLFVALDLERDRWFSVHSTIGVSRLISNEKGPIPVPVGVVETLIDNTAGDLTRLDAGLVKGQRVRIVTGPFADLIGRLERLNESGRARVLLEIMGVAVPVALDRSALAPAA